MNFDVSPYLGTVTISFILRLGYNVGGGGEPRNWGWREKRLYFGAIVKIIYLAGKDDMPKGIVYRTTMELYL